MFIKSNNVFVYGTLMSSRWNNHYMDGQEFMGEARLEGYEMYDVASFPGIVPKSGRYIIGEVYRVDERTLKSLDRLEGEGHMYKRVVESANIGNKTLDVYVYRWLGSTEGCRKVDSKEMPWQPAKVRAAR